MGYSPWGHKELDTTELLTLPQATEHLKKILMLSSQLSSLCKV